MRGKITFKRLGITSRATSAGFVVNGLFRAARGGFQILFLRLFYREVMGCQLQLFGVVILHMRICGVVGKEILRIVLTIDIGKHHWIVRVRSSDANRRAGMHRPTDGQRLAGGEVHIVCLSGDSVASHDGVAAEFQLSVVTGVDINAAASLCGILLNLAAREVEGTVFIDYMNRAALFAGLVAADLAAGHVDRRLSIVICALADRAAPAVGGIVVDLHAVGNVDGAPAHENSTAVPTGGIAGDLRAAGNVDFAGATHVDGAAAGIFIVHSSFIARDRAACQIDCTTGGRGERTAVQSCVILDRAAVHIEGAAGGV